MSTPHPFDFDEWKSLAERDPLAFERRRRDTIEAAILACPDNRRPRLRGLQFRIDMERRRAKCALGACVRMSEMMREQVVARFQPVLMGSLALATIGKTTPPRRAEVLSMVQRRY